VMPWIVRAVGIGYTMSCRVSLQIERFPNLIQTA
jgi:hypothetical protein